jgi:hypothetical protein
MYAQLNNIGTILQVDATLVSNNADWDVSAAQTLEIRLRSDGGVVKIKTGTLTNDGTDGLFEYTTISADDLDEVGRWTIQGRAQWVDGTDLWTRPAYFKVIGNLA